MIKIINKLYLFIFIWAGWGVYEKYDESITKEGEIKNQIQVHENKIRKLKKEIKKIAKYRKNIDTKKKEIQEVTKQIEVVQRRLPNDIADAENIKYIRQISDSLKIRKVNIAPGLEESKGFYISKRYSFTGEGTYLQFLLLLEKIAESEQILDVKDISLIRIPNKKKGRYEIVKLSAGIESFKYNASHQEDTGIRSIEDNFKKESKKKKPKRRKKRKRRKR
jgi:Tfp pilus assembly protein PilO